MEVMYNNKNMPEKNIDQKAKKLLIQTLSKLKGKELLMFLENILSSAEIKDISRRTYCAKLLKEKKTFEEVHKVLGMGSNTTTKVYFKTKGSPLISKLFKK
jgi:uncharacterized protein YerC